MLENDTTQLLHRHITGGIRCAMHAHPEFGLQGKHIGSVAKRIVAGIAGEVINEFRQNISPIVTKESLYQEIQKENEELRKKIEDISKSNKFLLGKLRENGIKL